MSDQVSSSDPIMDILRAPGTVLRLLSLAAVSVSLFLPALYPVSDSAERKSYLAATVLKETIGGIGRYYQSGATGLIGPLLWAFPLLIVTSLVLTAIPAVRRYVRLTDLAALLAGLALLILLFVTTSTANDVVTRELGNMRDWAGNLQTVNGPQVVPGLGYYALAVAPVLMAIALALLSLPAALRKVVVGLGVPLLILLALLFVMNVWLGLGGVVIAMVISGVLIVRARRQAVHAS